MPLRVLPVYSEPAHKAGSYAEALLETGQRNVNLSPAATPKPHKPFTLAANHPCKASAIQNKDKSCPGATRCIPQASDSKVEGGFQVQALVVLRGFPYFQQQSLEGPMHLNS